jgi:hypothetical protein
MGGFKTIFETCDAETVARILCGSPNKLTLPGAYLPAYYERILNEDKNFPQIPEDNPTPQQVKD